MFLAYNLYIYIGSAEGKFKSRYNNHTLSFRSKEYKHRTELWKHIWSLQDSNTEFSLKWRIKAKLTLYQCAARKCDLCLPDKSSNSLIWRIGLLNKRSEFLSKCWHRNRFIIENIKWTKTSAVTEIIIASLFRYQLNCVIVKVSVECYTPVRVCFY